MNFLQWQMLLIFISVENESQSVHQNSDKIINDKNLSEKENKNFISKSKKKKKKKESLSWIINFENYFLFTIYVNGCQEIYFYNRS